MALSLTDCTFFGPALPEPFVKFQLEALLRKKGLLPAESGPAAKALQERWEAYRRRLKGLGDHGLERRVASHVLDPLTPLLGYARFVPQGEVETREGREDGGWSMETEDGQQLLRCWTVPSGTDLDAPNRRGRAYRFSPSRVAQRVLGVKGERAALLTDGEELRLLLRDPGGREDSHIGFHLDRSGGWRGASRVPDSFRLLLSLGTPAGIAALPDLIEEARLTQTAVTTKLRLQARRAIEDFVQELLDQPANASALAGWSGMGNGEWAMAGRSKEAGNGLSRVESMAGGDGPGGGGLSVHGDATDGREIRVDLAASAGGGEHSVEHRRGERSNDEGRVHSVPWGGQGIAGRVGDAASALPTAGLAFQRRVVGSGDFGEEATPSPDQLPALTSSLPIPHSHFPIPHARAGELARQLWREGLAVIYRLLFVFKLESSPDPARAFTFASTSLWRNTYSPNVALAPFVRRVLDDGIETGGFLEASLRALFRLFAEGLKSREMRVAPLGGMLFGTGTTHLLDQLCWGERGVAKLLDRLLWTPGDAKAPRQRVYYGPLDVEDLGRVYEALLELEPGIAGEPMCRLRRAKLEVVVPAAQGERYRRGMGNGGEGIARQGGSGPFPIPLSPFPAPGPEEEEDETEDDSEAPARGRTQVEWKEAIPAGRFYLRVGLGRKATGSYYTPHPFVKFLVQETLDPQIEERSPRTNPQPGKILALKVLDPAMGSGHFLVHACRHLGDALYEACRLCDELALQEDELAEKAKDEQSRTQHLARAAELLKRVEELPDPDNALLAYLPSRIAEGEAAGLSMWKARALCRRLVAVHCLYGVDKNVLAVELAKLSLWLESYAEGLPLTFLDHRLICGDSLTGPFFEHLLTYPSSGKRIEGLFVQGLTDRLKQRLAEALVHVRDLEKSVGKDVADLTEKEQAKRRLDEALAPFRRLAAAWSGGVMLGGEKKPSRWEPAGSAGELAYAADPAYEVLLDEVVGVEGAVADESSFRVLERMGRAGKEAVPYDLMFPEVFHPDGAPERSGGFDAVVGNPPWDAIQFKSKEFLAAFDLTILDAPTKRERERIEGKLLAEPEIGPLFLQYQEEFEQLKRANDRLYEYQKIQIDGDLAGRQLDAFRVFMERNAQLLGRAGLTGVLVPSAFHANAGATGVRKLYLEKMALNCCFSFENQKKLFDIDSRFKFAAVVARSDHRGTSAFRCRFFLHDLDWLFDETRNALTYSIDFVNKTGGAFLSLIELRTAMDAEVAEVCFASRYLEIVAHENRMVFGREIDTTNHSRLLEPCSSGGIDPRMKSEELLSSGFLLLREGKSFRNYDDLWAERPRYKIAIENIREREDWLRSAQHFRAAYRRIAGPGDESVSIWCMLPPGSLSTDTSPLEVKPFDRPTSRSLAILAMMNTHVPDWLLQLRVRAHVDKFMLLRTPVPRLENIFRLLSHAALRLTCNHTGYAPLWTEQVGDAWREPHSPFPIPHFPVLAEDAARWAVRAAIDAVVADAYGLSRDQYAHVLSTFSHRSYPKAPKLCLTAFDELKRIGLEAFTRKHDPYWDIPLNESLPKPVIDLPVGEQGMGNGERQDSGMILERTGQARLFTDDGPLFAQRPAPAATAPAARTPAPAASAAEVRQQSTSPSSVAEQPTRRGRPATALDVEISAKLSALLRQRGLISSADAQQATGLDAAGVRPYLERLVSDGLAVVEGKARGTKYRWNEAK